MALGTSPGNDSTEDIMACVWAYGGNIIDKQNRVVFNSPGAVKGFQLIKDMYLKHQIIPKGTLSWDNSGQQQGLPVEAGGLRLQPAERLLLPPPGGQGDGGEDRPLPGARAARAAA